MTFLLVALMLQGAAPSHPEQRTLDFASSPCPSAQDTRRTAEEDAEKSALAEEMDAVRGVMKAHAGELKQCFAAFLREAPLRNHRLQVTFDVSTRGEVTSSSSSNDAPWARSANPPEPCVAARVRTWSFERPKYSKTLHVVFPVSLRHQHLPWSLQAGGHGEVEVHGAVDADGVQRVLVAREGELGSCYARRLQSAPDYRETLTLKLVIGAEGKVTRGTAVAENEARKPGIKPSELGLCLLDVSSRWTFPKPRDGKPAQVLYRMDFRPVASDVELYG